MLDYILNDKSRYDCFIKTVYAGTINTNSKIASRVPIDSPNIKIYRSEVKAFNKVLRNLGSRERYRIKLQGRGSRTNSKVMKYYEDTYPGISIKGAKQMAARSLPLSISEYVDVYIYKQS